MNERERTHARVCITGERTSDPLCRHGEVFYIYCGFCQTTAARRSINFTFPVFQSACFFFFFLQFNFPVFFLVLIIHSPYFPSTCSFSSHPLSLFSCILFNFTSFSSSSFSSFPSFFSFLVSPLSFISYFPLNSISLFFLENYKVPLLNLSFFLSCFFLASSPFFFSPFFFSFPFILFFFLLFFFLLYAFLTFFLTFCFFLSHHSPPLSLFLITSRFLVFFFFFSSPPLCFIFTPLSSLWQAIFSFLKTSFLFPLSFALSLSLSLSPSSSFLYYFSFHFSLFPLLCFLLLHIYYIHLSYIFFKFLSFSLYCLRLEVGSHGPPQISFLYY
ncbi:unnamed protein product [Acanthosepion pharaonis]|uniref:Uncharacterized protein n=1 Tax=Acanthosepion pharaonis TaxID=158019 RepID=A0A812BT05_ACAPH|nr:unnamed protein product [Sepia pharaonis]